jgi:small subunit ribosomal protein S14
MAPKAVQDLVRENAVVVLGRILARAAPGDVPERSVAIGELTGRARAYYRKLRVCRNMLRQLASQGLIPGMVKSSW